VPCIRHLRRLDFAPTEIASVAEELKKEQVAEWIQRAERPVQQDDYTTLREVLLRLLKVDSQHIKAR
jgi:hypothetical protein